MSENLLRKIERALPLPGHAGIPLREILRRIRTGYATRTVRHALCELIAQERASFTGPDKQRLYRLPCLSDTEGAVPAAHSSDASLKETPAGLQPKSPAGFFKPGPQVRLRFSDAAFVAGITASGGYRDITFQEWARLNARFPLPSGAPLPKPPLTWVFAGSSAA